MKTIVVLFALVAVAFAAPTENFKRERKSPTLGLLKGLKTHPQHHEVYEPHHHYGHPLVLEDHHYGHHSGHGHGFYREDESVKSNCAKEVEAKCGLEAKESESGTLTKTEEEMNSMIAMAKSAVDNIQLNLEDMESKSNGHGVWKHTDATSDVNMHQNIRAAKLALETVQKHFDEIKSEQMQNDFKDTEDLKKIPEQKRMEEWKEAIENIQKNVQIANSIRDSFFKSNDSNSQVDVISSTPVKTTDSVNNTETTNHTNSMKEKTINRNEMETSASSVNNMFTKPSKMEKLITEISNNEARNDADISNIKQDNAKNAEQIHDSSVKHIETTVTSKTDNKKVFDDMTSKHENERSSMKAITEAKSSGSGSQMIHEHHLSNTHQADAHMRDVQDVNNHLSNLRNSENKALKMNVRSDFKNNENLARKNKDTSDFNQQVKDMDHHESIQKETKVSMKSVMIEDSNLENHENQMRTSSNKHVANKESQKAKSSPKQTDVSPHSHSTHMDHKPKMNHEFSNKKINTEKQTPRMGWNHDEQREANFNNDMISSNNFNKKEKSNTDDEMMLSQDITGKSAMEKKSGWNIIHEHERSAYGPSVAPSYGGSAAGLNLASSSGSSGGGAAVGVFPNANVGGCAVPLLLSCSPSVVPGSLAKSHHASYGASQASAGASGGYGGTYGAPASAASAGASGGYGGTYGAPAPAASAGAAGGYGGAYGAPASAAAAHASASVTGASVPASPAAPNPSSYGLSYGAPAYKANNEDISFQHKRDLNNFNEIGKAYRTPVNYRKNPKNF